MPKKNAENSETVEQIAAEQPIPSAEVPPAKAAKEIPEASVAKYTIPELVAAAKRKFDTAPECVTAALSRSKKTQFTLAEAQSIVSEFLKKEVK